jgi:GAF domain-containing protein
VFLPIERCRSSSVAEDQDEAERLLAHLSALQALTDPKLSELGIASMAAEVLARACEALDAQAGALHLSSDDGHRLLLRAVHGTVAPSAALGEIEMGDGMLGRVASTGRAAVIQPLAYDGSVGPWPPTRTPSIVAVPLRTRGQVTGVLHASSRRRRPFDATDVMLMSTAADRLASAVDCARLHEAERRAQARTDDALKERDDFRSMASHELKTPMTNLVLLAQCLLRGASSSSLDDDLRGKLESLEHQIMSLAELSHDLLDVSVMNVSGLDLELASEPPDAEPARSAEAPTL